MDTLPLRHVAAHHSLLLLRSSPSSSSSSFYQPKLQNATKVSTFCSIRASPFTEKHSVERYQRDGWMHQEPILESSCPLACDSDSIRENDIALQLPELKKLLVELNQRRADAAGGQERRAPGNVFLVGTGPGDPELLTVKAMNAIREADLILYDRLVSNDIMDLISSDARLLYVGKTAGYHSRTQEEIHELLLSFAEAGATVVRLKGGDPLVFGRGGEEMDFLRRQGFHVKVIPGITAASGIAAELGIPLTHRGIANRKENKGKQESKKSILIVGGRGFA